MLECKKVLGELALLRLSSHLPLMHEGTMKLPLISFISSLNLLILFISLSYLVSPLLKKSSNHDESSKSKGEDLDEVSILKIEELKSSSR